MAKILRLIPFFILVSNVFIQAAPIIVDENEDIMATLARLHQETDRVRRRLNPVPDLITFASNDIADRLKRYLHTKQTEEDPDTVYVNLKVNSEEDLETKYVNLYIDTKRDINTRFTHLNQGSGYINTNVVYTNIKPASNDKSYPRYYRHRQTK